MSITVIQREGRIEIVHGSERKRTVVSRDLVRRIVDAKVSRDESASNFADEVVKAVKASIDNDTKLKPPKRYHLLFELAVYGRAVLKMHPSALTHITLTFEPGDRDTYRSISTMVGKERDKLNKQFDARLARTR